MPSDFGYYVAASFVERANRTMTTGLNSHSRRASCHPRNKTSTGKSRDGLTSNKSLPQLGLVQKK